MTFRYFNLILIERKWFWTIIYVFDRKANLNSLLCEISFNPIQDGLFWGWGEGRKAPLPRICHTP